MTKTNKNKHVALPIIILLAFISWSWLFLIDAAKLSQSVLLGYGIITMVFVVIMSITTFIAYRAWLWIAERLKKPSLFTMLQIVLVWAVAEFLIAWFVSVVWMGHNGSWDNVLPFYSLTPLIMATPLRFLSRMFGYFGTSAVIGTGILLLCAGKQWWTRAAGYWLVVLCVNAVMFGIFHQTNGQNITALITSETLGQPQKIDISEVDLAILPEYGLDNYSSDTIHERFEPTDREVYFSGTQQVRDSSGGRNVLMFGSNKQGYTDTHVKSRLIVGGEYISLPVEMMLRTLKSEVYDDFQVRRALVRGQEQLKPFSIQNDQLLGTAACSSIINPEDYRKLTRSGATILANSSSLEIFRGSRQFEVYHDGFAKFMATANARPFLQSANNWKAFALDHNGSIRQTIQPVGSVTTRVQSNSKMTPYSIFTEWLALLGGVVIFSALLRHLTDRYRLKN